MASTSGTAEKALIGGEAESLNENSLAWLASADRDRRKSLGQYMTPRAVRNKLVDAVTLTRGMKVLDPGVGTGEFLSTVLEREPSARVVGWDVDPEILKYARKTVPTAELLCQDALSHVVNCDFDLVIGNPPYFQFKPSKHVRNQYARVISGRPNIFALFFDAALRALKPGWQLAFVVPPSMNNGAYFNSLRKHILDLAAIEYLEILDDPYLFDGAQTSVQLIVLKKGITSNNFVFTRICQSNGFERTIFTSDAARLSEMFQGRKTLCELGYAAVTGSVVWNQVKDRLVNERLPNTTQLVWAHNLCNGSLQFAPHAKRPQYVLGVKPLTGPAIVANRIVGSVGNGSMRCALVPDGMRFVGENHTNVILKRDSLFAQSMAWDHLLRALLDSRVSERIRLLTGNTQVSATELTHLLPLDC